jgi:hypothetical protein
MMQEREFDAERDLSLNEESGELEENAKETTGGTSGRGFASMSGVRVKTVIQGTLPTIRIERGRPVAAAVRPEGNEKAPAKRGIFVYHDASSSNTHACDAYNRGMLTTIAVILIALWLLGMVSSYTISGFIHILLVIAIVMILVRLIRGENPIA